VLYEVRERNDSRSSMGLEFRPQEPAHPIALPPPAMLPKTGWQVARQTRADAPSLVRVVRTLEDAPFYSRSLLDTQLMGEPCRAIHESLDLNRFRSRWVQCLLPFRMPRISR
jgi:carotenoid 1,2-hydratase